MPRTTEMKDDGVSKFHWLIYGLAGAAFVWVVYLCIHYFLYPSYISHGQPSVFLLALNLLDGKEIYTDFSSPYRTSNVYGPITYTVHAAFVALFGASVGTGKVASLLAASLFPALAFVTYLPMGRDQAALAALLGAAFVLLLVPASIWNRPDTFITVSVMTAVWAERRKQGLDAAFPLSALIIGVCGGLAVGMKVHAGIYFIPLSVLQCLAPGGAKRFIIICVAGTAVLAAPFGLAHVSLSGLLAWYKPVLGKPFDWGLYVAFLRYSVFFWIPVAVTGLAWMLNLVSLNRRETLYLASFVFTMAIVSLPAAKSGAGWHYLYPFAPFAIDVALRHVYVALGPKAGAFRAGVLGLAIAILVISIPMQKRFFRSLHWQTEIAIQSELEDILATNSGRTIEMGVGEKLANYRNTFQRTRLVIAGHPYTFDAATQIEASKLGYPLSAATLALIRACRSQIWLIPTGERPFTMLGYYGNTIFSDDFRTAFHENYVRSESRRYFDLWLCNH